MNADKLAQALRDLCTRWGEQAAQAERESTRLAHLPMSNELARDGAQYRQSASQVRNILAEHDAQPAQAAQGTREQVIALLQTAIEKMGDVNAVYEKLLAAQPVGNFTSDEDAYESNCSEGIWTAGINTPHPNPKLGTWDARIECHGESKESAEQLRDQILDKLSVQPVGVPTGMVIAQRMDIQRLPEAASGVTSDLGVALSFRRLHALCSAPQPPAQPSADAEDAK